MDVTIGSSSSVEPRFRVDEHGRWQVERHPNISEPWLNLETLTGLADIDLEFTPATNILPIRRLQPAIGEAIAVTAARLRFPELVVEPLPQTYHRLDEHCYRYEAHDGKFSAELLLDDLGLVIHYEGLFERVATSG